MCATSVQKKRGGGRKVEFTGIQKLEHAIIRLPGKIYIENDDTQLYPKSLQSSPFIECWWPIPGIHEMERMIMDKQSALLEHFLQLIISPLELRLPINLSSTCFQDTKSLRRKSHLQKFFREDAIEDYPNHSSREG
ncbi:hypothetical protein CEXT_400551 [Caerostris extrusa]|uniref:Uncharacterized protein n=1 Tax=Caerostris extrusa TaxID=172846 RepID=A0AAV4RHB1_CAEEX|nr:hypothetical protein CEXT_400551 [Caerostris extrusa]